MVDFHAHILPGIDDGSDCVKTSLAMLQMEAEQGIEQVVATPHFYPNRDHPAEFLSNRDRAEERLLRELEQHPDLPRLSIGAEVYFFHTMSESDFLPQLTIRGSSCIMIEMGQSPWSEAAYRELELIHQRWDLVPIIAHVDRYIAPLRTHGIPERLAKLPVLVQANASFFSKRSTAHLAMKMLRKDQIHLLGSDCHNTSSRKPDLGAALQVIEGRLGADVLSRIRTASFRALQDETAMNIFDME